MTSVFSISMSKINNKFTENLINLLIIVLERYNKMFYNKMLKKLKTI